MVMAIWLIASEVNNALPRRLIYVVDRRTVVDQATDLAMKLKNDRQKQAVDIYHPRTLADNREWSRTPRGRQLSSARSTWLAPRCFLWIPFQLQTPAAGSWLPDRIRCSCWTRRFSKPFEKLVCDRC